jgi:hypothetical protein
MRWSTAVIQELLKWEFTSKRCGKHREQVDDMLHTLNLELTSSLRQQHIYLVAVFQTNLRSA